MKSSVPSGSCKRGSRRDRKRVREFPDIHETYIPFTPLDIPYIGPVQSAQQGESFLGEPAAAPDFPKPKAERLFHRLSPLRFHESQSNRLDGPNTTGYKSLL